MKHTIFADENIPFVTEAFNEFGNVTLFKGRELKKEALKNCELLLVRSVTKVGEELLEGTAVKYAATATAGLDHVDQDYLKKKGITFAHAKGSNAKSVASYVAAALLDDAVRQKITLAGKKIAVIGCGFVGKEVIKKAVALGMTVLPCDPPLQEAGDKTFEYLPYSELYQADFITFHTSLERGGKYPTENLCSLEFLSNFKNCPLLINASRGEVAVEKDLKQAVRDKIIRGMVLDVWQGEPLVDNELLDMALQATPHIAGYSYSGKLFGTQMIYDQAAEYLGLKKNFNYLDVYKRPTISIKEFAAGQDDLSDLTFIRDVAKQAYNLEKDTEDFKKLIDQEEKEFRAGFDRLRKDYPRRCDWKDITLSGLPAVLVSLFSELGFKIK